MNKVILMGRLTRDPETRYTQSAEPLAVTRYSLAVNKKFKRDGEPDADFINCTAFGKTGEFADKYFKKGQQVSVVGRLQVKSWEDNNGNKRVSTDVVVEEQFFAENKRQSNGPGNGPEDFGSISEPVDDDDMPF